MRILSAVARTACLLLLVAPGGCAARVDLGRAEAAVKAALDRWQQGGRPADLTDQAIDIAEPDWQAGYRLLEYQMKSVSEQPQQGPRVIVELNLQNRAGRKARKEVAYEVLMKDKVQIGRVAFHVGP